MIVLPDGRGKLNLEEIKQKIWLKMVGKWEMEPDGVHFRFLFVDCSQRIVAQKCKPCGWKSKLGHYCQLKESMISVSYCKGCNERTTATQDNPTNKVSLLLSSESSDLLGTESTNP